MARAPLPPTLAPASSAAARSRTRSRVATPASPLVSAAGRTLTRPESSRCQAGPVGATASCTPATPPRRAAAADRIGAGRDQDLDRGEGAAADAGPLQAVEGLAGRAGLGQDGRRRLAQAQAEGGHAEGEEHGQGGQGGQPAVAGHPGRPAGPERGRPLLPAPGHGGPAAGRPVEPGPDGGQQHRQQGEGGQGRGQRDEQAGVADAAQDRHRQQDQGSRPTATVPPLVTTARPAVAMAAARPARGRGRPAPPASGSRPAASSRRPPPSPISATRNWTMKLTSTSPVRPSTARKVVRMATAAISSGTRARNEPNTKASTSRAPMAPTSVSTSTPVPAGSSAAAVRSASRPVTWTGRAGREGLAQPVGQRPGQGRIGLLAALERPPDEPCRRLYVPDHLRGRRWWPARPAA